MRVYLASSEKKLSDVLEEEYLMSFPVAMRTAILRYRRWEDRQATIIGKLMLRQALNSRTADGEFAFDKLEYTEAGKPYMRGGTDFNISHSGGIVALVLVDSGTVGIDVEKIRSIQMEDFSRYIPEVSEIEGCDTLERLNIFYSCWTRKEAVLKAEGSGLLAPLEQVGLHDDRAFFKERVWHIRKIDCGATHCCHVATSEPQEGCRIEMINF